jgi:uncharacterized RDD family membrane protein YckC
MAAITVLNKANVPTGPFTREQVAEKLRTGEMALTDLAFVDGLSQWTPLREVLAKVDGPTAPPAPPPVTLISPPPAVAPAYSYAATMAPPTHLEYAGFWLRAAALIIDGIILCPLTLISFAFKASLKDEYNIGVALLYLGFLGFSIVAKWLYFALLESSGWQATLGKKALGLRVTDISGQRIGFGQATGRYFAKILSALTLFIGYMMAGFTERKQALHDMIASTLVVRQ